MRPLMTTAELAELLDSDQPTVLDVRWRLGGSPGRADYERAHLPGAVYLDVDTDLAAPPGPAGRHPLPEPGDLERVLRAAGVRVEHPVVVYDDDNGSVAARAWWLLRWSGHSEVTVLDGGYAAWVAEERPVSADVPATVAGNISVRPGGMPVLDADGAGRLAVDGVLLDARAAERYQGAVEPVDPRAGHIPGARSAPFSGHIDEHGRWREPTWLAQRFRGLGVREGESVGAYCGSGVTATSIVLALEHAGLTSSERPAALYAGSWSNWSADPDRQVATGPDPKSIAGFDRQAAVE